MYANVELQISAGSNTVKAPEEAIIHSGERSVVIVQKAKGLFEPREVQTGVTGEGYTQVLRGLRAGETIVTSSQFLIDSESNLKAAISALLAGNQGVSQQEQPPAGAQH
jgi:Cu(I)/Ag(I) efflux system membrane fusion protein